LTLLNGADFFGLAVLVTITFFTDERAGLNFLISVCFLALAILCWL